MTVPIRRKRTSHESRRSISVIRTDPSAFEVSRALASTDTGHILYRGGGGREVCAEQSQREVRRIRETSQRTAPVGALARQRASTVAGVLSGMGRLGIEALSGRSAHPVSG